MDELGVARAVAVIDLIFSVETNAAGQTFQHITVMSGIQRASRSSRHKAWTKSAFTAAIQLNFSIQTRHPETWSKSRSANPPHKTHLILPRRHLLSGLTRGTRPDQKRTGTATHRRGRRHPNVFQAPRSRLLSPMLTTFPITTKPISIKEDRELRSRCQVFLSTP